MEYVPCIGNSSYSFWWILLKLYRCFKDGLEICILFFQNPEIIFYHFFRIFNLDIFRALILQICIWSIYLVSATPPTVFGESFWNFTVVFRMVWRYAYCFLRILKLFFLHFNLDIFSSLYATDMYREYMPCIGNPAYSFRPILLKLYRYFAAFLWFHMRNLSLAGYNCSGGASCMACSFISIFRACVPCRVLYRPICAYLRRNSRSTCSGSSLGSSESSSSGSDSSIPVNNRFSRIERHCRSRTFPSTDDWLNLTVSCSV